MWGILLEHTAVVVKILKKDQINVNYQDGAVGTALMLAIESENDEICMALLDRKDINITLENVGGESALDYARKNRMTQGCWERSEKDYSSGL